PTQSPEQYRSRNRRGLDYPQSHRLPTPIIPTPSRMVGQPLPSENESGRSEAKRGSSMNDQTHIQVLSVDDHPLLNEGIAALIKNQPDMQLLAQATSGQDAIEKFRGHHPDVTLMDLRLPDMSGIDTMIAIRSEFPEARIIMLTTFEGDMEIQ